MTRNCQPYAHVQAVFIPLHIAWAIALSFWVYNTFLRNRQSANNLHKLLAWLPAVECIYTFLCIFYYAACPWTSFSSQLVAAALLMVVILKEPLNLLCLLLVAKGWCITRDSLSYNENRIIVVTVVLLYASVVFELFAPDNSSGVLWMIPIIIAYMVMLTNAAMSTWTNMRILKSQLLAMAALNINPLTTPAYAKYVMFRRLAFATAAYVAMELLIHTLTSVLDSPVFVFLLCHQLMELVVVTYIGVQFRARPLSAVFQQMQQFSLQLAEQLLPSVTTISLNRLELSAPGMVEWSDKMEAPPDASEQDEMTLIVVNPGGEELSEGGLPSVQTAVCVDFAERMRTNSEPSQLTGPAPERDLDEPAAVSATRSAPAEPGPSGACSSSRHERQVQLTELPAPAAGATAALAAATAAAKEEKPEQASTSTRSQVADNALPPRAANTASATDTPSDDDHVS